MKQPQEKSLILPYLFLMLVALSFLVLAKMKFSFWLKEPLLVILTTPRKTLYLGKIRLWRNLTFLITADLYDKLQKIQDNESEIEVLKAKLNLLQAENRNLRQQLEAPLPPGWDFLPALVLGWDRYLLIDKGVNDGVKSGMAVVFKEQLIGQVVEASAKTARVRLLTDPDSKVPAKTIKNSRGLTIGAFGNRLVFSRVLQKEPLTEADLVLTSGEADFPPNLVIGKIGLVNSKEGEIYKEAELIPLLDYSKLENVFVVLAF